jgi:hypothetical protein
MACELGLAFDLREHRAFWSSKPTKYLPHATEVLWYPSLFLFFSADKASAAASADIGGRTFGVETDRLSFDAFEGTEPGLLGGDTAFVVAGGLGCCV